jgi:protein-tyrosine kinase
MNERTLEEMAISSGRLRSVDGRRGGRGADVEKDDQAMSAVSTLHPVSTVVSALEPVEVVQRVEPAEPVEPEAAVPDLTIDVAALRASGLLPEVAQDRRLADQYRRIKRPILNRVRELTGQFGHRAQMLMVASALPGDGKTFTSLNLALSIARERDFSVLLVDADVSKRHISRAFGLQDRPGLLDAVVQDSSYVGAYIVTTDIPNFSILPAGRPRETATELLSSVTMSAVAANLCFGDSQRVVVFDSPPLLVSSEARAIASLVTQIILVVRSGVTPQAAVREAKSGIEASKLTGIVFNGNQSAAGEDYYGYGYFDADPQVASEKPNL